MNETTTEHPNSGKRFAPIPYLLATTLEPEENMIDGDDSTTAQPTTAASKLFDLGLPGKANAPVGPGRRSVLSPLRGAADATVTTTAAPASKKLPAAGLLKGRG